MLPVRPVARRRGLRGVIEETSRISAIYVYKYEVNQSSGDRQMRKCEKLLGFWFPLSFFHRLGTIHVRSIVGLLSTNGKRGSLTFIKNILKPLYLSRLFINTTLVATLRRSYINTPPTYSREYTATTP